MANTRTLEWLDTGRQWHARQAAEDLRRNRTVEQFERDIATEIDALRWHAIEDGSISGPMSPILMLKEVIEQMELRPVVGYAYGGCLEYPDGPETATYSLLGVEVQTSRQHFRLYLMDTGLNALSLCIDWIVGDPT